jgi:6-phosphogluconolactonase (cycloisomerase 2 family)
VYIALRGDDKIMVFTDEKEKLTQKLAFRVGKWPRHFTITDYGLMYIACQKEDRVYRYLFKEDKIMQIGELTIQNPTVVAIVNDEE